MITYLLVVVAVACTIYRLTVWYNAWELNRIEKAKKMPVKIAALILPEDAEESSTHDCMVYKDVKHKYLTNKKEWKAVCGKCPGCGTYLPKLFKYQSIVCPGCGLTNYKHNYNIYVWK